MDKMRMASADITSNNIEIIGELFPNCLTERIGENGKVEKVIDFDVLRQELSKDIVEGAQERYQFTWPDKKKAIRQANAPSTMTLRPCRKESVDFDNTQNLYIEGDNLEVLKLLRENYLGKVNVIYIDPPYNTGNDFVYEDDFHQSLVDYEEISGNKDSLGNRLFQNTDSNGRFHTDWLNMFYPRIKIARDFLSEDGVIFISIDDHEVENTRKICDEIFGSEHFVACFPRLATKSGKTPLTFMISHDYVLVYTKKELNVFTGKEYEDESYKYSDEYEEERGKYNIKQPLDCNSISYSSSLDYPIEHNGVTYYPGSDHSKYLERKAGKHKQKDYAWRWSRELFDFGLKNGWIVFQNGRIYTKGYLKATIEKTKDGRYEVVQRVKTRKLSTIDFIDNQYSNDIAKKQVASYKISESFDYPKPVNLVSELIESYYKQDILVMDFFSGSGTTAESIMSLNSQSEGKRKYILVQLPEAIDDSDYKTICEIGKERIRRAGKRVLEEHNKKDDGDSLFSAAKSEDRMDVGFRVLKLDTSNMEDVYYRPEDSSESTLFEDNVKPDRSGEDLLFQVMLECNLPLSAKIQTEKIAGKEVFSVNNGYLIACFDEDVNEEVITAVAKRKPYYFIMRDKSLSSDNVADNFEQIFQAYSKETIRRIL